MNFVDPDCTDYESIDCKLFPDISQLCLRDRICINARFIHKTVANLTFKSAVG